MKLNYTIERPSTLPAVCTPSASWLAVSAPVAKSVLATESAYVAVPAAERAPASQAHQVQIQAELVRILASVDGSNGTTGFVGSNGMKRRLTDGADGVPPRGRPV